MTICSVEEVIKEGEKLYFTSQMSKHYQTLKGHLQKEKKNKEQNQHKVPHSSPWTAATILPILPHALSP